MKHLILVVSTVLWLAFGAWALPAANAASFNGAHLQTVSQRRRAHRHHAHRAKRHARRHVRRHRA